MNDFKMISKYIFYFPKKTKNQLKEQKKVEIFSPEDSKAKFDLQTPKKKLETQKGFLSDIKLS